MVSRNPYLQSLSPSYLFPEVGKRVRAYQARFPDAKIIRLSVGDTSEPLPPSVCKGLTHTAQQLGTIEGYRGYGPEQGEPPLRERLSETYYQGRIEPEEIFISDGAKCDLARLLMLFGPGRKIAVQNPTYPTFVDATLLFGQTPLYLPCLPENNFFPDLSSIPPYDLLYFCSPNNPTGAVATRAQLESLVASVRKNKAILLYDAAYAPFISDPSYPRSIYEIPGAKEVAIEVSSFSKLIGFTGVRLGWTVVPKDLHYHSGHSIRDDWNRVVTIVFNGASSIAQAGGEAALHPQGLKEMNSLIAFYRENAHLLRTALRNKGYEVYGGEHAPYLWVRAGTEDSWSLFQQLLETKQIVTTPGSGFGSLGDGFLRFSAFGNRSTILEAIERIKR